MKTIIKKLLAHYWLVYPVLIANKSTDNIKYIDFKDVYILLADEAAGYA